MELPGERVVGPATLAHAALAPAPLLLLPLPAELGLSPGAFSWKAQSLPSPGSRAGTGAVPLPVAVARRVVLRAFVRIDPPAQGAVSAIATSAARPIVGRITTNGTGAQRVGGIGARSALTGDLAGAVDLGIDHLVPRGALAPLQQLAGVLVSLDPVASGPCPAALPRPFAFRLRLTAALSRHCLSPSRARPHTRFRLATSASGGVDSVRRVTSAVLQCATVRNPLEAPHRGRAPADRFEIS